MIAAGRNSRFRSTDEVLESFRSDFEAAKVNRFNRKRKGIPVSGANADWHYRNESDYLRMGEYARDIDRNDMVVGSVIDRAITNQVQEGFAVNPNTGDVALDRDLKERWLDERDNPRSIDHEEQKTFADIEFLAARDIAVAGDVFAIFTEQGTIQIREQHRCRSPYKTTKTIVHGVEFQEGSRRRQNYWFTKKDIDGFTPQSNIRVSDLDAVAANDAAGNLVVSQLMDPKRFTQTRGVTAFAPIFAAIGMHDDIEFATLLQRQVVSAFGWIEQKLDAFNPIGDEAADDDSSYDATTGMTLLDVRPGMVVRPPKGVRLESFSSNVPGSEFFPHVRLILTFIGINLGMPLCMALMDGSETNFSGYRGAVDQARLGFRRRQRALKTQLHAPYWCHKVRFWANNDRTLARRIAAIERAPRSRINPFRHDWHAPSWPYIQPQEDATANTIRLATGQISRRRLDAENGLNADEYEVNADRADEIRDAMQRAQAINKEFGWKPGDPDYVTWLHISTLPMPDQIRVNISKTESIQVGAGNAQPNG